MSMAKRYAAAAVLLLASGMVSTGCQDQDVIDGTASESEASSRASPGVSVTWQPTDHTPGSFLFFVSELTITNRGPRVLGPGGWHLYFNFVRRVLRDGEGDASGVQDLAGQGIRISKADAAASGDFDVLEPLANFQPLAPGETRTLTILAENWAIMKTDAPAGFHIQFDGDVRPSWVPAEVLLDANDPKQTTRFEGDVMPVETPALRQAVNAPLQALGVADRVLPVPRRVDLGRGTVTLQGHIQIERPRALAFEAEYLAAALGAIRSSAFSVGDDGASHDRRADIRLRLDASLDVDGDGKPDAEGYILDARAGRIDIVGRDAAGVFHGVQTLRQLVPMGRAHAIVVPAIRIADAPGFAYRGMHLDVARHFQPVETVKKLIDLLAYFKLNKLHLHLADDEGWRLEIPGIPELTTFGARRGHDLDESDMLHMGLGSGDNLRGDDGIAGKPASQTEANGGVRPTFQGFETATLNFVGRGDGFFTTRDFEEILTYATERHIDVIPEFDMPGHARAAVLAMEHRHRVLQHSDPGRASQYRLVDPDDTSAHTSVQGYTDNFVNPCLPSSYAFLQKVVSEVQRRYRAAGAPLVAIHGGGDELPSLTANVWWQGSPACAANPDTHGLADTDLFNLFFTRWNRIITSTGAAMTGWDDIIHGGLALPGFMPMPWSNVWTWGREDDAYHYANQGYKVILSHATNLYMDLANSKDPEEPGYYWANFVDTRKTFEYRPFDIFANGTADRMGNPIDPSMWDGKERLTAAGKANVIGMHGLLWGENLKTPELMEYMAFPKILGVAERAWNPELPPVAEMPRLWSRFANALGQEILPRLGAFTAVDLRGELPRDVGVNYRVPPPGGLVTDGVLSASVEFPGLPIEFSTDGGRSWRAYGAPVRVAGMVALRTHAPDGRTSRIAWVK